MMGSTSIISHSNPPLGSLQGKLSRAACSGGFTQKVPALEDNFLQSLKRRICPSGARAHSSQASTEHCYQVVR